MKRALALGAILLSGALAPAAEAHRGSQFAATSAITRSNMNGQCGNGLLSYCYPEYNAAWIIRAADAHTWLLGGYWQERRVGHGRFSCTARFLAGPHGRGWIPSTERCYKL